MKDYRDAYEGAREDLLIWKRRALAAEAKVREYDQRIVDVGSVAINSISRESHEAAIAAAVAKEREAWVTLLRNAQHPNNDCHYFIKPSEIEAIRARKEPT